MGVKGLDSFLDVFEVVKDPKKYEEKVEELKVLTAQYREVVEAVVALAGVNDYTKNIKEREESSKKELDDAKEQANTIRNSANEKAKQKLATLVTREALVSKSEEQVSTKLKEIGLLADECEKRKKALDEQQAYIELQAEKLRDAERILAERQAKLAAALQ